MYDPEDVDGKVIKVGSTVLNLTTNEVGRVIRIKAGGYPVVEVPSEVSGKTAHAEQPDDLRVVG
jgi:hypothetical protein